MAHRYRVLHANSHRLTVLAAALAAVFASLSSPVFAQSAPETQLKEIRAEAERVRPGSQTDTTNTGSKTDTPLRDLPASVVVIPKEVLRDQSVVTMNEAITNASGVQPQHGGGYGFANNYKIRGLDMMFLRDGYRDGFSQNGYWRTMADVESIEILKGPGSALYGTGGGPGGSINLTSKKPEPRFGAELSAFAGSFNTRGLTGDVTGKPGSIVTGRVGLNFEKSDGFRGLGRDIKEFTPAIDVNYAPGKMLSLEFDYRDIKVIPDNLGIVHGFDRQITPGSSGRRYYTPFDKAQQQIERFTMAHTWNVTGALTWRAALVNDERSLYILRNVTGNVTAALPFTYQARQLREQYDKVRNMTLQNELVWKAQTGSVAHTVLGGFEYTTQRAGTNRRTYTLANIANINNPVIPETSLAGLASTLTFDRSLSANTASFYAQDQITFTDGLKARVGLRNDRVRFTDAGVSTTAVEVAERKSLTTGSAGLVWQPVKAVSLFAGWSKGAFINLATEANRVSTEPEKSTQRELGVKASWMGIDGQLAWFKTERENYYITLPGAAAATPDGKDRTTGIELDLNAQPMRGLNILANFVSQDPVVTSNTNATNNNTNLGAYTRNINGLRPTAVARTQARVWASYELQDPALRGFGFGAGVAYKGNSFADSLNLYEVPGYTTYDASLFYRVKKWDVSLKLNNLTNKIWYASPTFTGALPGEPRNLLLTARIRFD